MKTIIFAVLFHLSVSACCAQLYEKRVVAAVIMAEARGEGRKGMQAVYEVIQTRSEIYNLSTYKVVTKPKWFSCLNRKKPDALVAEMSKQQDWSWAMDLVSHPPKTSHANGADHYTVYNENPWWSRGHRPVARIGRHAFYSILR